MKARQIKATIREVMAGVYYASRHFLKHLQGKILILTYHRVLSEKELRQDFIQPGMYVRDDVFEKQVAFLKEHFKILSFAELLNLWSEKKYIGYRRYCVITFDDGWLDNYLYAYPILQKYNIPATMFLPTAFIGTKEWFWPDTMSHLLRQCDGMEEKKETIKSLWIQYPWAKNFDLENSYENIDSIIEMCKGFPDDEVLDFIEKMSETVGLEFPDERLVLNWKEVNEMSQNNISFGSHSCTHKILTKLSLKEIQKEIEYSLQTLAEKQIHYIPVFCYPNGNYTQEIVELVRRTGYQAAVSTRFGFEHRLPKDLFALKRISIHHDLTATIPLFTFHISGLNHLSSFIRE